VLHSSQKGADYVPTTNKRINLAVPDDLYDKIADETVGTTEEEILPFLEKVGHPALSMDPIIG
jgi:CO dehydrogenase/acetyl-CoA synthase beta subunit